MDLDFNGIVFKPQLSFSRPGGTGVGCFSAQFSYARIVLGWPRSINGVEYKPTETDRWGNEIHHPKFRDWVRNIGSDMANWRPRLEDAPATQGFTPKAATNAGVTDRQKLMTDLIRELGIEGIRTALTRQGISLAVGMYIFGDSIGEERSWTSHFAAALRELNIGTLTESPAVANPNHIYDQSLCQAWFWVPPWAESTAIERTPRPNTRLSRDMDSLRYNISKRWDTCTLRYPPRPEVFQAPEKWVEPVPAPAPETVPPVRKVRVRKPKVMELSQVS